MKIQTFKLGIFLILFGCSVSAFAQTDDAISNDKSSEKSVEIERLDDIYPAGKVFIPNRVYFGKIPLYSQTTECSPTLENNATTVEAQSGDTVAALAKRHGANPVEVAKYNGLFVISKLPKGRKIKIPIK